MKQELNKVHCMDWTKNNLEDKSVQLIIADPPYFEVKGEFDFIWSSFEDYLKDVEKWAIECKRLLADNGTLIWWGDAKKISYSQIIFDKYFNLLNCCVWENTNPHKQQIKFSEGLRSFAPLTERFLVYSSKAMDSTGLETIKEQFWEEMSPFSKIILHNIKTKGFTKKEISLLQLSKNGNETGWLHNKIKGGQLPTKEQWYLICELFKIRNQYEELRKEYEELRKEYEELRKEYEELRRPFNNLLNYGDCIRLPNFETASFEHETIKPERLTRDLIECCSRVGDLVLVPFAGSGTECAMSARSKRNFIGFDIEQKYVDMANKRCKYIFQTPTLF